jgi:hypothetical protein
MIFQAEFDDFRNKGFESVSAATGISKAYSRFNVYLISLIFK